VVPFILRDICGKSFLAGVGVCRVLNAVLVIATRTRGRRGLRVRVEPGGHAGSHLRDRARDLLQRGPGLLLGEETGLSSASTDLPPFAHSHK